MRRDKLLAEWFWTDRWMGSSGFLLPMEARGLYREMLTAAWRRGARLPNDPEAIQRAVGCTAGEWERCWPKVSKFWRVDGEGLVNDTQLEVFEVARGAAIRASERGRKGAQALHKQSASRAQAERKHCPPSPSPSPSQEQQSPSPEPTNDQDVGTTGTKRESEAEASRPPPTQALLAGGDLPWTPTTAAKEVFAYWQVRTKHEGAQWTPERGKIIQTRLSEEPGTIAEKVAGLKLAVDGAVADPWFNGTESGRPYLDFLSVFKHKGRNRIEQLQSAARRSSAPQLGKGTRASISALNSIGED